jgi:hypothetical protein
MKKFYDNLVYFTITEILYDQMKSTNFGSFGNMCNTININITHGEPLSSEEYRVVANTMSEISYLYQLSDDDTVNYLNHYFKKEIWNLMIDIVVKYKFFAKNSYQNK